MLNESAKKISVVAAVMISPSLIESSMFFFPNHQCIVFCSIIYKAYRVFFVFLKVSWFVLSLRLDKICGYIGKTLLPQPLTQRHKYGYLKGTVIQTEKALINDRLRVLKVS